ncbi:MAG: DNA polymerase III subunit delta [Sphingorhabdus sp.]
MSGRGAPRKLSEAQLVDSINSHTGLRLVLVFGQDESAISDICSKLSAAIGEDAERVDIDSDQIRKDPALLADEAGSLSLFGSKRYIRLNIRREEGLDAIANLLDAAQDGDVVIASAGNLKKTSKIRKLAEGSPRAITHICYALDDAKMAPMVMQMAQQAGLKLDRSLALQISRMTGQDRKLAAMEVEKLALYYDAEAGDAKAVEPAVYTALSAQNDEENVAALINRVMGGELKLLGAELSSARQTGIDAIRIVRALQRRISMLIGLRGKVDGGLPPDSAVNTPAIFWKEKPAISAQLRRWPSARLARLNGHILDVEKRLMSVKADTGSVILEEELIRISRAATRAG